MTAQRLRSMTAGLILLTATSAYAQSEGCAALMQAGADAISGQIALENGTIKQPQSVRSLSCLGDFFGNGLSLLTSVADIGALVNNMAGQFYATLKNAWDAQLGAANCGLTVTGINYGFGLGGGNFCPKLTIGGGGATLGQFGTGGGGTGVVRSQVTRNAGLALPGRMMAPSCFQVRCVYGPRCWSGG